MPTQEPPDSLCILRLSAIGDCCHTLPVVRAIQDAWPETRITWIIGAVEHQLLAGAEGIEFITVDKRNTRAERRRVRRLLADRDYPVLLNMHASMRANLMSRSVPARRRIGFDRVRARDYQWLFTRERIPARPRQHVMEGLFGFAEYLGITAGEPRWDIPVSAADRDFAARAARGVERIAVISPLSSQRLRNFRNWPQERFVAVADYLAARGARVILTGGPTDLEREYAHHIEMHAKAPLSNLVGKSSLKQLFALLQRADILVCPDSGPAHIATAAGCPVVGLYATSNPGRTGPYFSAHLVANRYPDALARYMNKTIDDVRWGQRVRHPDAMDLVSVADVTEKIDLALAQGRRTPALTD